MGQMDPDLVGDAGNQIDFHQGTVGIAGKRFYLGQGLVPPPSAGAAVGGGLHAPGIGRVMGQRQIDGPGSVEPAVNQTLVDFLPPSGGQVFFKLFPNPLGPGHGHQSRCPPIQAVDKTRFKWFCPDPQYLRIMTNQDVGQGAGFEGTLGMGVDSPRFFNHQEGLVLEANLKGETGLGDGKGTQGTRKVHGQGIPRGHGVPFPDRQAVDPNPLFPKELLPDPPGEARQPGPENPFGPTSNRGHIFIFHQLLDKPLSLSLNILMARALRMEFPNTFYHILSRGNEKRAIFFEDKDYHSFLDILGEMVDRFNLEVHAYVLMKNHYHLLIRTKEANLSRAIQWLGVTYSVRFNHRHQRSGHLFQGRFKSFIVENEQYFLSLALYIHGNPQRAGIAANVDDYPWSSFWAYKEKKSNWPWLTTDLLLGMFGGSRRRFLRYQETFLAKPNTILQNLRHGLYFGSEKFGKEFRARLKNEDRIEKPQLRSLLKEQDLMALALRILSALGERDPELSLTRRKYRCRNKDVAIYILHRLGLFRNKDIGKLFGVGYSAVTGGAKRGLVHIEKNNLLSDHVQKIIGEI
jgi:REP element-mobilizing transposase RayT